MDVSAMFLIATHHMAAAANGHLDAGSFPHLVQTSGGAFRGLLLSDFLCSSLVSFPELIRSVSSVKWPIIVEDWLSSSSVGIAVTGDGCYPRAWDPKHAATSGQEGKLEIVDATKKIAADAWARWSQSVLLISETQTSLNILVTIDPTRACDRLIICAYLYNFSMKRSQKTVIKTSVWIHGEKKKSSWRKRPQFRVLTTGPQKLNPKLMMCSIALLLLLPRLQPDESAGRVPDLMLQDGLELWWPNLLSAPDQLLVLLPQLGRAAEQRAGTATFPGPILGIITLLTLCYNSRDKIGRDLR